MLIRPRASDKVCDLPKPTHVQQLTLLQLSGYSVSIPTSNLIDWTAIGTPSQGIWDVREPNIAGGELAPIA